MGTFRISADLAAGPCESPSCIQLRRECQDWEANILDVPRGGFLKVGVLPPMSFSSGNEPKNRQTNRCIFLVRSGKIPSTQMHRMSTLSEGSFRGSFVALFGI